MLPGDPLIFPADDCVDSANENLVLLLSDISPTVDYFLLENFLLGLKNPPEMLKVRFLFFRRKYSVALQFKRPEQVASAQQARNFSQSCGNRLANFLKVFGTEYTIAWARVISNN